MKSTFGYGASTNRNQRSQPSGDMRARANQVGFTLIELVIAVVLVGILAAVAIVGLTGITKTGNNSACNSALGSAQAAAATYYANTSNYPPTLALDAQGYKGFDALVHETPALLTLPSGVSEAGNVMNQGTTWSVTMQGGGTNTPNTYVKTAGGTACT